MNNLHPGTNLPSTKTLTHIYNDPDGWLNVLQRERFCENAREILENPELHENTVRKLLTRIWHGYDVGWHSVGRSTRSVLLEGAMNAFDNGDIDKARKILSVLVAMYHDTEYIDSHSWVDFKVEHFTYVWLRDLFTLSIAGILLGIDELPDIRNITKKEIYEMVA